jgi:molecular chaperone GrpE
MGESPIIKTGRKMPEQQNDSKDGGETEKNAPVADTFAGDTGITADPETDTDTPHGVSEGALDGENPAELADNGELLRSFIGEAVIDDGNWPDEAAPDEKTSGVAAELADLKAKSAELAAQLAEARDQLLRKAAEFENFRKRMNAEKQGAIEFANQSLILDIIPVIDDFERAIQSAESSAELNGLPAGKAVLEGITMIEKRLVSQLESKWGLRRFISVGEPFDPNIHEAMTMGKSPDIKEPVVQEEYIKGYMLKDRVIRAAKVKVLMPEEVVS